jgi:EAL domain-containing protein (putative c-di-GMP-specific phosphodiesterase class I)
MEPFRKLPPITMAFQPIVDVENRSVWGYEALVRGARGASAGSVFSKVARKHLPCFEDLCRSRAFELASTLWTQEMEQYLSVNASPLFLVESRSCVSRLEEAVHRCGLQPENVVIELTEMDRIPDLQQLAQVVNNLRALGFKTAIDDFGSGHSGLLRLAEVPVDYIKLDMDLVRNLHKSQAKLGILDGVLHICRKVGSEPIAEGVESEEEAAVLTTRGVRLLQGFHFACPEINTLPEVQFESRSSLAGDPSRNMSTPGLPGRVCETGPTWAK